MRGKPKITPGGTNRPAVPRRRGSGRGSRRAESGRPAGVAGEVANGGVANDFRRVVGLSGAAAEGWRACEGRVEGVARTTTGIKHPKHQLKGNNTTLSPNFLECASKEILLVLRGLWTQRPSQTTLPLA